MNRAQAQIDTPVIVLEPVHFSRAADPLPAGQRGVITGIYHEDDTVFQVHLPGGICLFFTEHELDGLEVA